MQWACQGGEVALARNPKSRPSPPCSYRLRREGVCARLHWAMWVINDSSLPDLPIHIPITLWFLVTLSIRSPFHP